MSTPEKMVWEQGKDWLQTTLSMMAAGKVEGLVDAHFGVGDGRFESDGGGGKGLRVFDDVVVLGSGGVCRNEA
jgi:hypothetical protein